MRRRLLRIVHEEDAGAARLERAVDVRPVGGKADEVARPQLDRIARRPGAHPAARDEHALDYPRPVREPVVVAVERELEHLGQPAAM